MYYIIIDDGKVVADSSGKPREFSKPKKARNFVNGRPYLGDSYTIVDDISGYKRRRRVNH